MSSIKYFSHYAADPYFNMAFDEWMFGRALSDESSIYLRLYSWKPGGITFGLHQDFDRAIVEGRLGQTPVIRRITGGRALYHDESELTYAIAGSQELFGSVGSVAETSKLIAGVLVDFLGRAGIDSRLMRQSTHRDRGPDFFHKAPCFASFARYEVSSDGSKIIASAQRRIDRKIFQHGAIKIGGVASHPAISKHGLESSTKPSLNPVSPKTFQLMENHFRAAFELFFGCETIVSDVDRAASAEVEKRLEMVRKNNRTVRDIF